MTSVATARVESETKSLRPIRWLFLASGIYGLVITTPNYFLETRLGEDYPPAITHPEFFYGFVGTCLAWQLVYLLIATEPVRYRPVMLLAAAAKGNFVAAISLLYFQGRAPGLIFALAMVDAVMAVFYVAAYLRTPGQWPRNVGD